MGPSFQVAQDQGRSKPLRKAVQFLVKRASQIVIGQYRASDGAGRRHDGKSPSGVRSPAPA
jgi:hypothetical protein